jgi:hypothetical protein
MQNSTVMKDSINYFALIVSSVSAYAASCVWFLFLFKDAYAAGLGKTKEQMDKGPSMLSASVMQLIGNFIMAWVLIWLMNKLDYGTTSQGMKLGAIVWLGFVAAVLGPMYAFQAFSFQFFLIGAGSILISLLIMGAILGAWK